VNKILAILLGAALFVPPAVEAGEVLPAAPPGRPDAVRARVIHVCFTADALREASPGELASRHGLRLQQQVLPYRHTIRYARRNNALLTTLGVAEDLLDIEDALVRTWVAEYDTTQGQPEAVAKRLQRPCGDIETAEPIPVPMIMADLPNDSLASDQGLLRTLQLPEAWLIEQGDSTVRIAISDSGVLTDHADLVDQIWTNTGEIPNNGIDDDGNGYVDDHRGYSFTFDDDTTSPGNPFNSREGHGTGVAGICGATTNNGIGVAGVAGRCKLVPLKTMPNNINGIIYGYESLLYCAVNGIEVVNCSWGGFTYTCTNERIVAYTIGRGTAVVAAAGNHGTTATFYPAAYRDVLSVGVTNPADEVIPMSARGAFVDVMAPGQQTLTTSNNGGYGNFCCTSGAAPIVAGIVGLIRSRHSDLSPVQACALARVASVDITATNPNVAALVPGRIDALLAMTLRPDSVPSLDLAVDTAFRSDGQRWGVGDTISVLLSCSNALATARNVRAVFDVVGPNADAIELLSTSFTLGDIESGATVSLGSIGDVASGLRMRVRREVDDIVVVRVLLSSVTEAGDTHVETQRITVVPAPSWVTLRASDLTVSVGDNARIGVVDHIRGLGDGVRFGTECGILYEGSLLVGVEGRAVDNARASRGYHNHFVAVKPLLAPNPLNGIVADSAAPDSLRIGVSVAQNVSMVNGPTPLFVTELTLTNTSSSAIVDPVMTYYLDWDLGENPSANRVELDVAPNKVSGSHAAIITSAAKSGTTPVVYVSTVPLSPFTQTFVIGYNNTLTYSGFSTQQKQALLQGALEHYGEVNDIAVLAGAKFAGTIMPGASRSIRVVFGIATTAEESRSAWHAAEDRRRSGNVDQRPFPNPTSGDIAVPVRITGGAIAVELWDALGRQVERLHLGDVQAPIDVVLTTSTLASGMYHVVVRNTENSDGQYSVWPIAVLR